MRKIYTGIDLGSDNVKIVVSEYLENKFHILASTSVKSVGIKKGLIIDHDMAVNSLKLAINEIERTLGTRVTEAIITVPSNNRKLSVVSGKVEIKGENNLVDGMDIINCLENAMSAGKIEEQDEVVSIIPITFNVDDKESLVDPKNQQGEFLEVKAVLATAPKKNIYEYFKVFSECNIKILDLTFSGIGDYYEACGKDTMNTIGAMINVGSETINISIFNKGILIKNEIIPLGSKNIDKDISYIYGVDLNVAKELKEKFAVCSRRYADINDTLEINLNENEKIAINQYEITEVVESRVVELLKLAKKQINDLTKRKISYIIVTGGISELTGFSYVVENILGINASTLNMTTIGIRNNKYSSAIGIIKYFHDKMSLRNKDITMIDQDKIDELMKNKKSMIELSEDTLISKLFGYITNN